MEGVSRPLPTVTAWCDVEEQHFLCGQPSQHPQGHAGPGGARHYPSLQLPVPLFCSPMRELRLFLSEDTGVGGICQHRLVKAIELSVVQSGPKRVVLKHARLFTFKNTVGPVTADVFTVLTSQPKPRRSDPEPRLSESHDSVSATHVRGKMAAASRMPVGQVISTQFWGVGSDSAVTGHASTCYISPHVSKNSFMVLLWRTLH